ncbi:MAG: gliding motility-associated C-terminal domain-containing protein, partial [Cyclobacteriaceae bacterium]|nr:gliding motility-associated C-terminal domain-containing protein [Cyclobacteriaceae bacterium]
MRSYLTIFKQILVIIALFTIGIQAQATHLRAGEIIVERINCQSLTFRITVLVYTDMASGVLFGGGTLRLGDGSDPDDDGSKGFLIPDVSHTPRGDLGEDVGTASYSFVHTYGAPGKYIISYIEQNRNGGVLNMDNSLTTTFFIEAQILVDPFLGCNNSPVMLIPPIDKGCPGVAFFHNPGAYDPDGDSLSYELTIPKKDVGTTVDNYRDPNRKEFFNQFTYSNEDGTGDPTFSIDNITGELKWDAPGDLKYTGVSEYNVAFIIREWRKIGGQWFPMGYVVRDMQ